MPKIGNISTILGGVEFEWRIEDFSSLSEVCYYSPDFSAGGGHTWCLGIYLSGWSLSEPSGHIDLGLCRCSPGHTTSRKFSLSIRTVEGEKYNEKVRTGVFDERDGHVFHRFLTRSELLSRRCQLLPNNVLTVICTMHGSPSADNAGELPPAERSEVVRFGAARSDEHEDSTSKKTGVAEIKEADEAYCSGTFPHDDKVLHDLKDLFLKREDCDVVIKVKDREFPVHRLILKARSPALADILRNDGKVVEIENCDPACFSDFLNFLYCGDSGMISQENVFSLFTVADKYQVQDLKRNCSEFMGKNVTVDTFCDTMTLALRHCEAELIDLATEYFTKNAKEIKMTAKWQSFSAEYPTECADLILKYMRVAARGSHAETRESPPRS